MNLIPTTNKGGKQGSASNLIPDQAPQLLNNLTEGNNDSVDKNVKIDHSSTDIVATGSLERNENLPAEGKNLTQPTILSFMTRGVKSRYPQLTSEWPKSRQIITGKKMLTNLGKPCLLI